MAQATLGTLVPEYVQRLDREDGQTTDTETNRQAGTQTWTRHPGWFYLDQVRRTTPLDRVGINERFNRGAQGQNVMGTN